MIDVKVSNGKVDIRAVDGRTCKLWLNFALW